MLDLRSVERPGSAADAVRALAEGSGRGLYVAGGTIVVPAASPNLDYLVDLGAAGLAGVSGDGDGSIAVGAMTSVADLARSEVVASLAGGVLRDAALAVANHTVRNVATVGGNVASWHFPTDLPPALLALDAIVVLVDGDGERRLSLEDLYSRRAETYRKGDLITGIELPSSSSGLCGAFRKRGRTRLDVATVNCAVALRRADGGLADVRIALNGVGAVPVRARELERTIEGEAVDPAAIDRAAGEYCRTLSPQSDHRAGAEYRRKLARVLIRRALSAAAGLPEPGGAR